MERPFERAASSRLEMGRLRRLDTGRWLNKPAAPPVGLREGAAPYGFFVDRINLDWGCGSRQVRLPPTIVIVAEIVGYWGQQKALARRELFSA